MIDQDAIVVAAQQARLADPADPRWSAFIAEYLVDDLGCAAFVEWARSHRTWQFNVADVADRVCAKPREAAIMILADIVTELEDEASDSRT